MYVDVINRRDLSLSFTKFVVDVYITQGKIVKEDSANEKSKINMDVFILPENILSYSHCLYFTSARSNRLRLLREAAVWRTLGLICGWIMTILFVFWLSSKFLFTTFPDNYWRVGEQPVSDQAWNARTEYQRVCSGEILL